MSENNLGESSDYPFTTIYPSISNNEKHCGNSMAYEPLKSSHSRTTAKVVSKDRKRARTSKRKQRWTESFSKTALLSILASAPLAMADCVSLSGSTQCPAFTSASVDTSLTGLFPFLSYVSDRATFDTQISAYVQTSYVQLNLSTTQAPPVCADSCAQFAESESIIISDSQLCSNPGNNAVSQIRADFTNCALPSDSLTGSCVEGSTNEPDNCGFGNSTFGLCQYCSTSGQNSTDTCCYNSGVETRCAGVVLPTITGFIVFSTSTASSSGTPTKTPTSTVSSSAAAGSTSNKGLSGGAIAGIVIGSLFGLAALIGLIFLIALCLRRRRGSQQGSLLNQPTPARNNGMTYNPANSNTTPEGYEILPGGRIARMSALEGHSHSAHSSSPHNRDPVVSGAILGDDAGYATGRRLEHQSSSSDFGDSPRSGMHGGILRPPPNRRTGSLSSGSVLGLDDPQTPGSVSSPQAMGSNQSEQLPFFKDYYSQDEIHPGDKVSTLWAYQPRAGDEFTLERGDMLKVVGIWDDGWATGVMINDRADEWDEKRKMQRDSGVSNTSGRRDESPNVSGEIKAFPLVCVCLPDHWRRTIEGDGSTDSGGPPGLS
ncbi:hypothetical protein NHQ30_002211 [Ciborinia camelliae]|nr:hypothetical protein NHQ30_002211 [Ciborinia camelliae]